MLLRIKTIFLMLLSINTFAASVDTIECTTSLNNKFKFVITDRKRSSIKINNDDASSLVSYFSQEGHVFTIILSNYPIDGEITNIVLNTKDQKGSYSVGAQDEIYSFQTCSFVNTTTTPNKTPF